MQIQQPYQTKTSNTPPQTYQPYQPISQSGNQPTNQSTNQPTNQTGVNQVHRAFALGIGNLVGLLPSKKTGTGPHPGFMPDLHRNN
jgi:hypothetical protein